MSQRLVVEELNQSYSDARKCGVVVGLVVVTVKGKRSGNSRAAFQYGVEAGMKEGTRLEVAGRLPLPCRLATSERQQRRGGPGHSSPPHRQTRQTRQTNGQPMPLT